MSTKTATSTKTVEATMSTAVERLADDPEVAQARAECAAAQAEQDARLARWRWCRARVPRAGSGVSPVEADPLERFAAIRELPGLEETALPASEHRVFLATQAVTAAEAAGRARLRAAGLPRLRAAIREALDAGRTFEALMTAVAEAETALAEACELPVPLTHGTSVVLTGFLTAEFSRGTADLHESRLDYWERVLLREGMLEP
jgi:hypothetical protein